MAIKASIKEATGLQDIPDYRLTYAMYRYGNDTMIPRPENQLISLLSEIRMFWQRTAWYPYNDLKATLLGVETGAFEDVRMETDINLNHMPGNWEAVGANWQLMRHRHFKKYNHLIMELIDGRWVVLAG